MTLLLPVRYLGEGVKWTDNILESSFGSWYVRAKINIGEWYDIYKENTPTFIRDGAEALAALGLFKLVKIPGKAASGKYGDLDLPAQNKLVYNYVEKVIEKSLLVGGSELRYLSEPQKLALTLVLRKQALEEGKVIAGVGSDLFRQADFYAKTFGGEVVPIIWTVC